MKNVILSSVVVALMIFTGCSSKAPVVEEDKTEKKVEEAQEVKAVEAETVVTDDAAIQETQDSVAAIPADTNEISMSSLEEKMLTIYFDFDKFVIRTDMQDILSQDANMANNDAKSFMLKLEGNCDEWGSDEYNFALGLKRANTVKNALVAEGVSTDRITMVSFGESNPTCNDKTRECWAKNRRVDFKLLP